MALRSECNACQMGDHAHHERIVQAVPEGMIGGAVCDCQGECVARGPRPDPQADRIFEALRHASLWGQA